MGSSKKVLDRDRPASTDHCVQINIGDLPKSLKYGGWERNLAFRLMSIAEINPEADLVCFLSEGWSVDFGSPSESAWLAFSGSAVLVREAKKAIFDLIDSSCIRPDAASGQDSWMQRIVVTDGRVLVPKGIDALDRFCTPSDEEDSVSAESEEEDLTRGGTMESSDKPAEKKSIAFKVTGSGPSVDANPDTTKAVEEPKSPEVKNKAKPTRKPNKLRSNISLGSYQQILEVRYGMPEGSIRFVNPDGSLAHPSQLVGTLRERYGEE